MQVGLDESRQHRSTAGIDRRHTIDLDARLDRGDALAIDRYVDRIAIIPNAGIGDQQVRHGTALLSPLGHRPCGERDGRAEV